MTKKLSTGLAAAHGFVAKLWKLTAPYFWSGERWSARALRVVGFHDRRLVVDPAARRLRSDPVALAG